MYLKDFKISELGRREEEKGKTFYLLSLKNTKKIETKLWKILLYILNTEYGFLIYLSQNIDLKLTLDIRFNYCFLIIDDTQTVERAREVIQFRLPF